MPSAYTQNFRARVWKETTRFWNMHRLGTVFFGLLFSIAIGLKRGHAMAWAFDVGLDGLCGFVVTFLGTVAISAFKAPRLLDVDRETEIGKLTDEVNKLRAECLALRTQIGRPYLFLRFKQLPVSRYELPTENRTEFIVHNTTEIDAYDIGIEGTIGPYGITNPYGGIIARLSGNDSAAKEYSLFERSSGVRNLEFHCQLSLLLPKLSSERGNALVQAQLVLSYKDRHDNVYSTPFTISHYADAGIAPQINLGDIAVPFQ